ncbi:MAG: magnesium transporter [Actinobacteria bacterium]|nr:magnesium transporter [Actinomycetota bacterium]
MDDIPGALALSELDGMTVLDVDGQKVGELVDVVASTAGDRPVVTAFFIQRDEGQLGASWGQVGEIDVDAERLLLRVPLAAVDAASLRSDELSLVDAVLDNQILDMRRRTFVRVQDVVLAPVEDHLEVAGVDASSAALARRFGLGFISRRLPKKSGDFVPWTDVNLIALRLSRLNFVEAFAELAELHPADIAEIIAQVGPRERAAVLAALNANLAADTLQEMDEDLRLAALQEMPLARAAKVLEKIEADEAADMLSELPDALSQELLALLPDKREQDLRRLASHPEHTAGSLMTTDFVMLPQKATAGKALAWIRRERPEQHMMTYLYIVDAEERLLGVVSLRDLVLAAPDDEMRAIMEDDIVQVGVDADEEEVGRIMTKYDLLAIPVVDEDRHLLGIVTLDDALEAVVPEDWKQRLPRIYR